MAEGMSFPRAPMHWDPRDNPNLHFPNPRMARSLKRPTLEEKYSFLVEYRFMIPNPDTTVNRLP